MNTIHKQYLVAEQQRLNPLPAHITKKAEDIVKYKFALLKKLKKSKYEKNNLISFSVG